MTTNDSGRVGHLLAKRHGVGGQVLEVRCQRSEVIGSG
jgi:hypothetical protein